MKIQFGLSLFILFITLLPGRSWAGETAIKIKSLDETCQSYSDEPMISDDLYQGKMIETSFKVESKRTIPSICSDSEQGTFTAEFVAENYVVQCVCNPPSSKAVFDTLNSGDVISIAGTFKSMTSAFFEGGSETCQVTVYGCALDLGNK